MAVLHARNVDMQNVDKFYLKKKKICGNMLYIIMRWLFMDLAHLISRTNKQVRCPKAHSHYWTSIGDPQASAGDKVTIQFECKHCNKRIYEFLTREQYYLYENQIKRSF